LAVLGVLYYSDLVTGTMIKDIRALINQRTFINKTTKLQNQKKSV
jgi:hypothetical protein